MSSERKALTGNSGKICSCKYLQIFISMRIDSPKKISMHNTMFFIPILHYSLLVILYVFIHLGYMQLSIRMLSEVLMMLYSLLSHT